MPFAHERALESSRLPASADSPAFLANSTAGPPKLFARRLLFLAGRKRPKIANKAQKRYKFDTYDPYNMLNQRGLLVSPKQEGTDKTPFFGARARSVASVPRGPSNRCGGLSAPEKGSGHNKKIGQPSNWTASRSEPRIPAAKSCLVAFVTDLG